MPTDRSQSPMLPGLLPEIWRLVVAQVEERPDCGRLPEWFRQNLLTANPEAHGDDTVVIKISSQLTREWLDRKYRAIILDALSSHLPCVSELRIEACAPPEPARRRTASKASVSGAGSATGSPVIVTAEQPAPRNWRKTMSSAVVSAHLADDLHCTPLNPKYTFDRFVVGDNNRFAYAAAAAVAETPGRAYNPLFIHGGVGLGKTHLAHAVGQEMMQKNPGTVVAYLSGEAFTTSFVAAIREKRMAEFRRIYRNVDTWLVDDVQFIASKERTAEEFFHVFNSLYDTGRQIVICSDRPPQDLRVLDDRLVSRFEAGLTADIGMPNYETRLAILEKKAEAEAARLPQDVLQMMARMIRSNVRVLEGALIRLLAHVSFNESPISLQMAADLLSRQFSGETRSPVRIEMVQRVICDSLDVPVEALTGRKRDRRSLIARQMAMFLSRELTECSLQQIGQMFGGKDHSTVAHACRTFRESLKEDGDLERTTERVRERIRRAK